MNYQALARKWRPQSFSEVVGQPHVITALSNALTGNRVHHAYLFSGTRGVGKTSIARLFAKGLNCERGVTAEPCGVCDNCRDIEQGRFIDLIEIDAASRTKVEDTREILDNVQYLPTRGRYKVYLIDEVHMLSRSSFNALLKTLEEPPEYIKFLLATTDPQKLPVTILSRCLHFHLQALDSEQIKTQLEDILVVEQVNFEPRALQMLAKSADGSMRDALSLTDQAIAMGNGNITVELARQMLGTLDDAYTFAIVEALVHSDSAALMAQIQHVSSLGINWDTLLAETLALLHQIAMLQLLPDNQESDRPHERRLKHLAQMILPQDLQLYYQIILTGRKELPYAPDARMGVEMTFLRALAFSPISPTSTEPLPQKEAQSPVIARHNARAIAEQMSSARPTVTSVNHKQNNEQAAASVTTIPAKILEKVIPEKTIPVKAIPEKTIPVKESTNLSPLTANLLQRRDDLTKVEKNLKKSEAVIPQKSAATSVLKKWVSTDKQESHKTNNAGESDLIEQDEEQYQWKSSQKNDVAVSLITAKQLKKAVEDEKTPELLKKLIEEGQQRDEWSAEVEQLVIPRLIKQLVLNAFKEVVDEQTIQLHLRSSQQHLNNPETKNLLENALTELKKQPVKVTIIIDDDRQQQTPLEWRQRIYEEKLQQATQEIETDITVKKLCQLFDATVDQESIRPV